MSNPFPSSVYFNIFQNTDVSQNLHANHLYGDGSNISGITLQQVTDTGNVTSNTINFSNSVLAFTTVGKVGVANSAPAFTLSVGTKLYVDEANAGANVLVVNGNVSAVNFSGSASLLTGLTGAAAGSYASSNSVSQVAVNAAGRITGISNVNISFQDVTRTGGSTDQNLSLTGTANLTVAGFTGLANASPTHTLDVGAALYVDKDARASAANVLVVRGNVSADFYYGDGSKLSGVASVDTLAAVVNRGNTTSNVVQFNGDKGFVTSNGVGIANASPAHTLAVGTKLYVDEAGANDRVLTVSGNVSAEKYFGNASALVSLTGAAAATYGSAGLVPSIVVDSNGRITSISTNAVTSNVQAASSGQVAFYDATGLLLGGNSGLVYTAGVALVVGTDLRVSGNLLVTGTVTSSNNVTLNDTILEIGNAAVNNTTLGVVFQRPAGNVAMGFLSSELGAAYTNTLTFSFTDSSAWTPNIIPDTAKVLPTRFFGNVTVVNDLIVGGTSNLWFNPSTNRLGLSNAAPSHDLDIGSVFSVDKTGGATTVVSVLGNVSATNYLGSAGYLSNTTSATAGTYGSSNIVSQVVIDANKRVSSVSNVTLSLNSIALSDNDISGAVLKLSNTTSLVTSGLVGIANASPTHTLDVGAALYVDKDARASAANVLVVSGNVSADFYYGDGSKLTNLTLPSSSNLAQVLAVGNATSIDIAMNAAAALTFTNNVLVTSSSSTAGIAVGNAASQSHLNAIVINASGTALASSNASALYVSPVRATKAMSSNVLGYTAEREVVNNGAIKMTVNEVVIGNKLFATFTGKSCPAATTTTVATFNLPYSETGFVRIDACHNDGAGHASAVHHEYICANAASGTAQVFNKIMAYGSSDIIGTGSSITDIVVTPNVSGTTFTVGLTVSAGSTISSATIVIEATSVTAGAINVV